MTFRGKTKSGEWVEGDLSHRDFFKGSGAYMENIPIIYPSNDVVAADQSYEILPDSLSMSTGLTDKNGKEIFGSIPVNGIMSKGGDRVVTSVWKNDELTPMEYDVEYGGGAFYPVCEKPASEFEIIGNQYEEEGK